MTPRCSVEALPLPPKSATQRIAEEDEAAAEVVVRLPVKIEVDANQQFDNEDHIQARPSRVVSAVSNNLFLLVYTGLVKCM